MSVISVDVRTISAVLLFLSLVIETLCSSNNLTCYQCTRTTEAECAPEDLLPCPPISDRCVTHITRDANRGFSIKRECGLGPCGFNDAMVNKGLGLDTCDRDRPEYFCIFCCRESGCNKGNVAAPALRAAPVVLLGMLVMLFFLGVFKGFQPPYVPEDRLQ